MRVQFASIREDLINNLVSLQAKVSKSTPSIITQKERKKIEAEIFTTKCQLWVIVGFIDHNLSLVRLENALEKYKKIGVVPQGYHQPILWS